MNVEVPSDMIGLAEANAELERMMAADQKPAATAAPPADPGPAPDLSATTEGSRAAPPGNEDVQTSSDNSKDGQLTAPQPTATDKNKPESTDKTPSDPPSSRFAKNVERQNRSWKELNDQKAALKAEQDKLAANRQAWEQQRAQVEQKDKEFAPEQYEQAADKWEKEGKFDLADLARTRATHLRQHPPERGPAPNPAPPPAAQQAELEAARKEWWAKAAIDFPSVTKEGTPEHQAMGQFLQNEPAVLQSPKALYYAARMVGAEVAASRVPAMEKELGALRAKVKEFEVLTASSPRGVPHGSPQGEVPFNQRSDSEQFADLERTAMEMGPLR